MARACASRLSRCCDAVTSPSLRSPIRRLPAKSPPSSSSSSSSSSLPHQYRHVRPADLSLRCLSAFLPTCSSTMIPLPPLHAGAWKLISLIPPTDDLDDT